MKTEIKFLRLALITSAVACALTLPPPRRSSARQGDSRSLGVVNIKVEDGKELRLYERSYALVIGVSDYTQWPKLPGVKRDVEEVARALERHGFLVTKVENPDSAQLDKSFREFIDAYGRGVETRLLFYFAGHGHTVRQSYGEEMGYIVPADAPLPTRDAAGFMSKAMDMQQMELYARRIQSKHALFLFDSCFSGAIFALSRAVPDAITYKTARPVRQFITSGSADEQVPDQSTFRRQFVEALDGEADLNKDGYVTGTELGEFLQDKVINYSRNAQHPQYGKLRNPHLDKGDFVFALPKKTAQPKPGAVIRTRSGIELVYVPPGSFMMGSENGETDEKPVHQVTIREGFYMGRYEVTQAQWRTVMGMTVKQQCDKENSPPTHTVGEGDKYPMYCVSWNEAQEFIQKLNAMNDDFTYRLPSEAQWEYACRAGTTGDYAGDLDSMAWYGDNSKGSMHPVGQKQPNALNLYDMHGNVWESCEDYYQENYKGAPTDGSAWLGRKDSKDRVVRGGAWGYLATNLRSADRYRLDPAFGSFYFGLRVVAVARQ